MYTVWSTHLISFIYLFLCLKYGTEKEKHTFLFITSFHVSAKVHIILLPYVTPFLRVTSFEAKRAPYLKEMSSQIKHTSSIQKALLKRGFPFHMFFSLFFGLSSFCSATLTMRSIPLINLITQHLIESNRCALKHIKKTRTPISL